MGTLFSHIVSSLSFLTLFNHRNFHFAGCIEWMAFPLRFQLDGCILRFSQCAYTSLSRHPFRLNVFQKTISHSVYRDLLRLIRKLIDCIDFRILKVGASGRIKQRHMMDEESPCAAFCTANVFSLESAGLQINIL